MGVFTGGPPSDSPPRRRGEDDDCDELELEVPEEDDGVEGRREGDVGGEENATLAQPELLRGGAALRLALLRMDLEDGRPKLPQSAPHSALLVKKPSDLLNTYQKNRL